MYKVIFFLASALLFLETASPAQAVTATTAATIGAGAGVTYYVNAAIGHDTNSGKSTTTPFATIQRAVYLTHPGDTVNVAEAGTYGPVRITHSGTEAAWITYQPYPGQHPVVRKDSTAWSGISVEANYIVLSGLTVLGNAQSITQAQATAGNTSNYTTNGHCISVPKTSHHIKILGNTLAYCPGAGIIFWGDYGWIERNLIHHNAYWSHLAESGIVVIGSNPLPTPGHIYVDGNRVYNNQAFVCNSQLNPCSVTDGHGIIVDSNIADTPPAGYSGRVEIFNNIVYNNGGWGLVVFHSQHVDIYNNTTWRNGLSALAPAPYTATGGEIGVNTGADVKVENNIFYAYTPGVNTGFGINNSTNYIWDYNVMYNAGFSGARPIGPHDVMLDPMLTTWLQPPQAFGLQEGSAGIGAGTPTLMPPTDYAGKARFAARVDCGAYTGWH